MVSGEWWVVNGATKLPSLFRRGGEALRAVVVVLKNQILSASSPPCLGGVPEALRRRGGSSEKI